ncbi:hypothetical protein X769_32580 [Mesorhizobium sp. LSJC268A00]|nr:hypothetical protein X769_32580 [Mesorhizobium sp. LSJC268A00]
MRFVAVKTEEQQARLMIFRTRASWCASARVGRLYLQQIAVYSEKIAELEETLRREAARSETTARLQTMPGDRTHHRHSDRDVCAAARDLSTWPRLRRLAWARAFAESTGGKQKLGRTSKTGQRDIRRLLIVGAMAVVRWAARKGPPEGSWLARMLGANPYAGNHCTWPTRWRGRHGPRTKRENYRDPAVASA